MTTKIENADKRGDSETVFRVVKIVSGLMTAASVKAPSIDKNDDLILDQSKLTQVWKRKQFLSGKFTSSDAEAERDPYEDLGPHLVTDPLTEEAFVCALQKIKKDKACGPDGIPGEVFVNCEAPARELYRILSMIWKHKYGPSELVHAAFVLLFKNKGNINDPTKYRCIGLLPHAYKILSLVLIERIMTECSKFLSV